MYLIGGTMGVGKTTVCQQLKQILPNAVFLDGDWCWNMAPFQVTEETKAMVLDNICHVLNNFLSCSLYENIIFGWVLHRQETWDEICGRLNTGGCQIKRVALTCTPQALKDRLNKDIAAGLRQPGILERSTARLPLYRQLKACTVDTSNLTPEETAQRIILL